MLAFELISGKVLSAVGTLDRILRKHKEINLNAKNGKQVQELGKNQTRDEIIYFPK